VEAMRYELDLSVAGAGRLSGPETGEAFVCVCVCVWSKENRDGKEEEQEHVPMQGKT
jgi:hypothetical protein